MSEGKFLLKKEGITYVTPLFLVLLMVETTDLLFAIDSVPAVFAVTHDPFIVFTSNVFAILGLRSLYFALAGLMSKFQYLKMSLVFILAYVGVKMLLAHHYPIPIPVTLGVIGGILSVGILASVFGAGKDTSPLESPLPEEDITVSHHED
jgi:tellurite resistance protein TerC